MRIFLIKPGQADERDQTVGDFPALIAGHAFDIETELDVATHGPPREKIERLKDEAAVLLRAGHRLAVEQNLALVEPDKPVDDAEQRRFAATARP